MSKRKGDAAMQYLKGGNYNVSRNLAATWADDMGDKKKCLAELGYIIKEINTVIDEVPAEEFGKGRAKEGDGEFLVLDTEEREMLDRLLGQTLSTLMENSEKLQTMQIQEVEHNGKTETAWSYDRFREIAIENPGAKIISLFSDYLSGLIKFSRKKDDNPYLMAFNPEEVKKYEAAVQRLKEDFVFYQLLQGDLRRCKAKLVRINHPFMRRDKKGRAEEASRRKQRDQEIEAAKMAYQEAFTFARAELEPTHPYALRIGLAFATMYYDFLDMPERAIELAKSIYQEVAPRVVQANKEQEASVRNAAFPVLQELQDCLFLWTVMSPLNSQDPKCYAQQDLEIQQLLCDE